MLHGLTKFQASWLDQTDVDGHQIGECCTSCKTSRYKAFCTFCMKDFSIEKSGLPQIQQHAKGEKHKQNWRLILSLLKLKGTSKRKDQGPVNIPIQDMSQHENVTTAEALWALKTAASDYSFASTDGSPQLSQKMFPGDVSANFTMSRTEMSYLISDGLGLFFWQQLCQDISKYSFGYTIQYYETGNLQGHKQCDILVRYWWEEKNEISVRI